MQDIDFDEIDRAVNSAANPRVRADMPTPAPSQLAGDPVPESAATSVDSPVSSSASPAVRRSSGRFMDVVHASSDMRPVMTRPQFSPPPIVPREEAVVQPSPEKEEAIPEPSAAFHWPDPIDAHEQATAEDPVETEPVISGEVADSAPEVAETPDVQENQDDDDAPVDVEDDEDENTPGPLESPFLSDAKVEKRPLGAFSDPELLTPEDFPSSQPDAASEPAVEPESQAGPEAPMNSEVPVEIPRELHDDVLSLGSHDKEEDSDDDAPESHEAPALELQEVPVGPTSITQQYTEHPTSDGEPSGAIFDTEIYNQALVHTPKSNRRVLIIVWIVALILVGAGIGAGIYFVIMPMLG
jgi:hypothetical protein